MLKEENSNQEKKKEKNNELMVLGKKIYQISEEERKQLMAEWRARRDGNGRKGFRKPSRLTVPTDNFEIVNSDKKWTVGHYKKDFNEHIKCIFICKREIFRPKISEPQVYFIGFLSDSNRFSFEELREASEGNEGRIVSRFRYMLYKYFNIFGKKNIDKDTTIVLASDEINKYNTMYLIISFIRSFSNCTLKRANRNMILKTLMSEYQTCPEYKTVIKKSKNYKKRWTYVYLRQIFDYVIENKLCPWLTEEDKRMVDQDLTLKRRRSYVLVHMGLLYALILVFKQFQKIQGKN